MKGARILICDDELLIRLWLEEHLREAGHRAEGVCDGAGRSHHGLDARGWRRAGDRGA